MIKKLLIIGILIEIVLAIFLLKLEGDFNPCPCNCFFVNGSSK